MGSIFSWTPSRSTRLPLYFPPPASWIVTVSGQRFAYMYHVPRGPPPPAGGASLAFEASLVGCARAAKPPSAATARLSAAAPRGLRLGRDMLIRPFRGKTPPATIL